MHKNAVNMTEGVIWRQLLAFSLPLILGDLFQQLYNTVDSIIVGRFIDKQALAAVSSSGPIVNILVGLFMGISTGATIVIARYFGADDKKGLRDAVHTTVAVTFLLGLTFTVLGYFSTPVLLRFQATPEDVLAPASTYLRIYFLGISGLILYNMLGGILRAVGDTRRPLYCLILCSAVNILLDVLLVVVAPMGVAGAAVATVVSQFISAFALLLILLRTREAYRLDLRTLGIAPSILSRIIRIGLPLGIQRSLVSVSNVMVNSRINYWGSGAMAAWGVYRKLDQLVVQIVQNLSLATATFTSQNLGAGKSERIQEGSRYAMRMGILITVCLDILLIVFRRSLFSLFSSDAEVLHFGSLMFLIVLPFQFFIVPSNIDSGVLRGCGNSTAPMFIMMLTHILLRQIYLYTSWVFIKFLPLVLSCYPFAWASCAAITRIYKTRWLAKQEELSGII